MAQFLQGEVHIETTRSEILAVLDVAANQANRDGMAQTANRLRDDRCVIAAAFDANLHVTIDVRD